MTSRSDLSATLAVALAVAAVSSMGCKGEEEHPVSPRSDVQVSLPAPPDLSPVKVETHHDDGILTVAGVVKERGSLMGEDVTVRGKVDEVFTCPKAPEPSREGDADAGAAPAPTGEEPDAGVAEDVEAEAPFCPKPPHLFLVDDMGQGERLLVLGSERTEVGEAEVGDTLTLTGRLELMSPDGRFIRQRGLVILPEPPEPEPEPDVIEGEEGAGPGPTE
ncbi:MAG: hypothetical protein ACQEXJ_05155 [Myxococcota bacterium]